MTGTPSTQTTRNAPELLTDRERALATLLYKARTALWREWVEAWSESAKQAFDATDPKDIT